MWWIQIKTNKNLPTRYYCENIIFITLFLKKKKKTVFKYLKS